MSRLANNPADSGAHTGYHPCGRHGSGQPAPEPLSEAPWPLPVRTGVEVALWSAVGAGVLALAVGAVLLLIGAVPGSSATEVAPPFCQGRTCDGFAPDVTLCADDAVTTASAQLAGREVELRISARCRAAWALLPAPRAGDTIEVRGPHDRVQPQSAPYNGVRVFTPMIPAARGEAVEACLTAREGRVCARPATPKGRR
ncbi:DUF2690 domain-containing protein [Streptantibioticus ferralitis]|uniref:DUF2690 domain-containing protein n=1 Tax=Streptantibioticus ferralitis TaxID=236510 RepID=A0ABT5Z248_9ACTN|nr:DUF2690 domain-containing protein [Streptantibioticus ferralitis]MDF2257907.1 DUF2690 domain-containing protein [Streptantibioticus ferralitis]